MIGRAEHLIRKIRVNNKRIKRGLAQGYTDRDAARKAKARHVAGEERIEEQKILISTLRSIGDSIAFVYRDQWDLKQMVLKEESGFLTGKRGTRLERKILGGAFEIGATVVMNDLTHTLRHGDITVFRPDLWPDGGSPFLFIEAKSGGGKRLDGGGMGVGQNPPLATILNTTPRRVFPRGRLEFLETGGVKARHLSPHG